jgi:hypothetical protein
MRVDYARRHLGASLTHGANYLLEPLAVRKKVPVTEAIVYDDIIKPVLEAKCFSCHNKANEKGGLALDNKARCSPAEKRDRCLFPATLP